MVAKSHQTLGVVSKLICVSITSKQEVLPVLPVRNGILINENDYAGKKI